jgi:hypothetical protein
VVRKLKGGATMGKPKAYEPIEGQMYQLLSRSPGERAFDHLDYASDRQEKKYLLDEYRMAFQGQGIELKSIQLPMKYWKGEK